MTISMDLHQSPVSIRPDPKVQTSSDVSTAEEPPVVGVLTRNIIPSPVIKHIISARIRHKDKNDVLFVSERSVRIKEYVHDGHLRDVALKADFGSHILAARAFGESRKLTAFSEATGLEAIIKREEPEPLQVNEATLQTVPPQILVLTLESNFLVCLFVHPDPSYRFGFVSFWHSLFVHRESRVVRQLGKHIATDPRCVNELIDYIM